MQKPRVFINNINKDIRNNRDSYHYTEPINDVSIKDKIDNMFNSSEFVYKYDVTILLKNNSSITTSVIALKNNYLITLDGDKINVDDIKDIKKAN